MPSTTDVARHTTDMLKAYRARLAAARIPDTVPIRVGECGWPTGPGRGEDDQARVLAAIVRTVAGLRGDLNVTHWELFTLRDADSGSDDVFAVRDPAR